MGRLWVRKLSFALGFMILGSLLTFAAILGPVLIRKSLHPWTEKFGAYFVIHVENDCDETFLVEQCRLPDEIWYPLYTRDGQVGGFEQGTSEWFAQPAWGSLQIRLRASPRDRPEKRLVTNVITHKRRDHIRLRIDEDGDVFLSEGGETWLGGPDFGAEVAVRPISGQ